MLSPGPSSYSLCFLFIMSDQFASIIPSHRDASSHRPRNWSQVTIDWNLWKPWAEKNLSSNCFSQVFHSHGKVNTLSMPWPTQRQQPSLRPRGGRQEKASLGNREDPPLNTEATRSLSRWPVRKPVPLQTPVAFPLQRSPSSLWEGQKHWPQTWLRKSE
jgi:hypothetical protein